MVWRLSIQTLQRSKTKPVTSQLSLNPQDVNGPTTAFVGRQPILSRDMDLYAYELLFRDGDPSLAMSDGSAATANVLINSLMEIGLDRVAGSARVFVNVTRDLLLNGDMSFLPPRRFVLEILEDVKPEKEILESVQRLSDDGFTIALDDYFHQKELLPLVELADIVKIDLPMIADDALESQIQRLVDDGKRVLAEKVETHEQFNACKEHGCELFQGYFFCRPQLMERRKLNHTSQSLLQVLAELNDADISLDRVEGMLATDASLCFRLLRYVNSANVATEREISTIRHAATVVGIARIRSLATMMLMSEMSSDKPPELMNIAMIRAKTCEYLSQRLRICDPQQAFTTGLVSAFDALLDDTMSTVVEMLPLANELNDALLHRQGELGMLLSCALNEPCDDVSASLVCEANTAATIWVTENSSQFSDKN